MTNKYSKKANSAINPIQNVEEKDTNLKENKTKKTKKNKDALSILNKKKEVNTSRFSLNIDTELYERLMTASIKKGYSITEIIATYVEYCLDNDKIEIDEESIAKYKEINGKRGNKKAKKIEE